MRLVHSADWQIGKVFKQFGGKECYYASPFGPALLVTQDPSATLSLTY
jgi:hypothetical protein